MGFLRSLREPAIVCYDLVGLADSGGAVSIGRDTSSVIRLDAVDVPFLLSRKHALFTVQQAEWSLRDCASTNGTYAARAGQPLSKLQPGAIWQLEDGDTLGFGGPDTIIARRQQVANPFLFRFYSSEEEAADREGTTEDETRMDVQPAGQQQQHQQQQQSALHEHSGHYPAPMDSHQDHMIVEQPQLLGSEAHKAGVLAERQLSLGSLQNLQQQQQQLQGGEASAAAALGGTVKQPLQQLLGGGVCGGSGGLQAQQLPGRGGSGRCGSRCSSRNKENAGAGGEAALPASCSQGSAGAAAASSGTAEILGNHLTCPICHEWLLASHTLSCGHMFCGLCLASWLPQKQSCPTCRKAIAGIPVRCFLVDNAITDLLGVNVGSPSTKMERKRKQAHWEGVQGQVAQDWALALRRRQERALEAASRHQRQLQGGRADAQQQQQQPVAAAVPGAGPARS